MRTTTQILPGIKAIGWVDCRHLPRRVDLSAICGMTVAVLTDIHPIPFYLIGSLEAPQPQVECNQQTGIPSGDAAGYAYEIKHVSIKSMVPCVI